jgi:uncharacterized protein (TIGR02145 family)
MQQLKHLLSVLLLITTLCAQAQVGIGTATPAASAQLDVSSTTKGLLPPRMTTAERGAIISPAAGLIIFNSSSNALEMYTGSKWISMSSSSADPLPSIQIGTQVWQAKNLDVAFYRNGDPIPQVKDAAAWEALTTGAWCWFNNDSTNGTKYGKLYNWYAVNDARGLAPQGWHIPTDAEWTVLSTTTLLGEPVAGGQMKEAGTLNWITPNTGGNNSSGFAGLPGGFRESNGAFFSVAYYGSWWSATVSDNTTNAWYRYLSNNSGGLSRFNGGKKKGFSVRCLRD